MYHKLITQICVNIVCNMWFHMKLIDGPLIGTVLKASVICSTQFSSALVTGGPHISNNALLSHSTHSKLANSEHSTAEHSTRHTHTAISHIWQLTLKMKTSSVVASWKHPPQRVDIKKIWFTSWFHAVDQGLLLILYVLELRHHYIWYKVRT